jgi:putative transposase
MYLATFNKKFNVIAAKALFRKAFRSNGIPDKVVIDKSGSNNAALNDFNKNREDKQKIKINQNK